jgi:uncharacterized protein with GYD domain
MPTYISLLNWTQQGIQTVREAPARLDAGKQAIKAAGGELKGFYLVMGQYDFVLIAELPNDEAVATLLLSLGAQGNVRSTTMRAFTEEEYRKLVAALPAT